MRQIDICGTDTKSTRGKVNMISNQQYDDVEMHGVESALMTLDSISICQRCRKYCYVAD